MFFKDEQALSLLPKIIFMTVISAVCLLATYFMFVDESNLIAFLKPYSINGNFSRQLILTFFCWFYILRLFITVFVFLKRIMAWGEMLIVTALMSFALFSFVKVGGNSSQPIGVLDYLSIFFISLRFMAQHIF